ncbi:ferritin-like domain-containing protein [Trichophaea hybrida]|nr:ferritin-like domain-containing protein [Trichophaea hybrida]
MTIFRKLFTCALAFGGLVGAFPLTRRQGGQLSDIDILKFALTLEHLESAFYREGFAKFSASDFEALGLDQATIEGLISIGKTEETHVKFLTEAIKASKGVPVEPCIYDFKLTTAASMVQTARILEAVGISAYLGAAPLVKDKAVLSAAASIVTVEARHQTFIRTALKSKPVPQAFDVAIGPLQIFTLASSFIVSCPKVSDLGLTPLPPLNVLDASNVRPGSSLKMVMPNAKDGLSCSFTTGDGGLQFSPFSNGACVVPDGIGGETFLTVTTEKEGAGTLADDKIVAGPAVLVLS